MFQAPKQNISSNSFIFTPYIDLYSESSYQKQSFKNDMNQLVKIDLKIIISWKNTYFW